MDEPVFFVVENVYVKGLEYPIVTKTLPSKEILTEDKKRFILQRRKAIDFWLKNKVYLDFSYMNRLRNDESLEFDIVYTMEEPENYYKVNTFGFLYVNNNGLHIAKPMEAP